MTADIAVVILTKNEERNLQHALDSACGWAREVFVLDSFSTDRTLDVAARFDCAVVQHAFDDYGKQRNFALDKLPIRAEWVFFLDADEWIPDALKREIEQRIASKPPENGFFVKYRFMWMGRWVKRGYYPTWILRLFRKSEARCEDRAVNEHLVVTPPLGHLEQDFIHEDRRGVARWIAKHNDYAAREASELLNSPNAREIDATLFGSQAQRKRWARYRLWNRLPPLVRPFLYFSYRYVAQGGFLDGAAGLSFHFLQALWYPLLIDMKFLEMRAERERHASNVTPLSAAPQRKRAAKH